MKKDKQKVKWTGVPTNNEAAMKEITYAIQEADVMLTEIDEQRANIKDLFDVLHSKYGMPRRVFNTLIRYAHKNNGAEQTYQLNEIVDAYEKLLGMGHISNNQG